MAINDDASISGLKGPSRPVLPQADRAELVAALRAVDYVVIFSGRHGHAAARAAAARRALQGHRLHHRHRARARHRARLRRAHRHRRRSEGSFDVGSADRLRPPDKRVNRILIVRLSALGDIVHALPVLRRLRAGVSGCADRLAGRRGLRADRSRWRRGCIARIIVRATADGASADAVSFAQAAWLPTRGCRYLRSQRYDAALDLQGLFKSAVWARASGARRVIGFDRDAPARAARRVALYRNGRYPTCRGHVIRKNLSILQALGIDPGPLELSLQPHATPEVITDHSDCRRIERLRRDQSGCGMAEQVLAAGPVRRAVAKLLRDRTGLHSLVTWGPKERDLAEAVSHASGGAATPAPPTSIADLAVLMRSAALAIAGDTGPLHIAAAVGAPIVGLFGPTRPERNGPWEPRDEVISRAPTCVCHHKRQCLRGAPCINEITVDEVLAAAERRLRSGRA